MVVPHPLVVGLTIRRLACRSEKDRLKWPREVEGLVREPTGCGVHIVWESMDWGVKNGFHPHRLSRKRKT